MRNWRPAEGKQLVLSHTTSMCIESNASYSLLFLTEPGFGSSAFSPYIMLTVCPIETAVWPRKEKMQTVQPGIQIRFRSSPSQTWDCLRILAKRSDTDR